MSSKIFKKMLDRYQVYLYSLKIKIPVNYWVLVMIISSLLLGILGYLIDLKIGIILFVLVLDLGLGIPVYLYNRHIRNIEKDWPSALKLIADTMKAGSSFEYALREVSTSDYGELSFEINEVIRRLEMGDSMQSALEHLSIRVESRTIRRTVTLIKESLRTGAQLADVLDEIANDTKYMFRIKKERITKTMLQTIFIIAAGAVIAPFIFGLTRVITGFLTDVSINAGIATDSALAIALQSQSTIYVLLDIYIVIEIIAASAIISLMRESNLSNIYLYFPALLTIGYIVYMLSQKILGIMLAGMI